MAEIEQRPRFRAIRLEGAPATRAGSQDQLRSQRGLGPANIAGVVMELAR